MAEQPDIARNYRLRLAALRAEVLRRLALAYGQVGEEDIEATFDAFVPTGATIIGGGQGAAQTLTRAYLRSAGGLEPRSLPSLAGTSKAGTITEALAGITPFILGAIAKGSSAEQAIEVTGAYFVDRLADNEITRVVDREIDGQAKDRAKGWEGITAAPTDACVGNAGFHTFDEDIYRHPGCDCQRVVVFA